MPIDPDLSPARQRRTLLLAGDNAGWFSYESENEPGYTDSRGITYAETSYTLIVATAAGDRLERVLLGGEVAGYVLACADRYGATETIAFREGLK